MGVRLSEVGVESCLGRDIGGETTYHILGRNTVLVQVKTDMSRLVPIQHELGLYVEGPDKDQLIKELNVVLSPTLVRM